MSLHDGSRRPMFASRSESRGLAIFLKSGAGDASKTFRSCDAGWQAVTAAASGHKSKCRRTRRETIRAGSNTRANAARNVPRGRKRMGRMGRLSQDISVIQHRLCLYHEGPPTLLALPAGSPHDRNGSLLAPTQATIPRPGPPCLYPYSLCFRNLDSGHCRAEHFFEQAQQIVTSPAWTLPVHYRVKGRDRADPACGLAFACGHSYADPETETTAVHSSTTRSSAHSRRLISLYSLTKQLPHSMPLIYLTRSSRASVSQHSLKRALLSVHSPRSVQSSRTALQTRSTASAPPPYFPYRRTMAPHADSPNESNTTSLPTANSSHAHHSPATRHVHPSPSDYGTANKNEARKYLRTYGLAPPGIDSYENQMKRCLGILEMKKTNIEKYQYLSVLRNTNVHLFYRLLSNNVKELTPLIYTPTVGEACQRWSELYTQPEGLYLSFADRGNLASVIENWPHDVEITVVTDGSRILGLGDLGINGMGIPVGKLSLYTACAGINPLKTLPITLDLGTNNQELINDPLYLGSRRPKVSADEEREFLDEMMAALTERWPSIVIQYEDFKNPFPSLERYKDTYTMFNDDIQGTGAVILAGFINAVKQSGVPAKDQLAAFFINEGLTEDEARKCFWLVDSKGMVTNDREGELAEHKRYFSRDDNNGEQYKTLEEVVDYVKPTILMGLSTIGGAFTPQILEKMAAMNDRPVVFPLSNPSSKSECTFEDAIKYTKGKCLFASGSPFPTLDFEGQKLVPGQGNNMCKSPVPRKSNQALSGVCLGVDVPRFGFPTFKIIPNSHHIQP
ncbi:hypothetical protein Q7P35_007877 [Cladosporium inversicolor]